MTTPDRFSHRVGDYVKYRPSYLAGAIDRILQGLDRPVAAALGASTESASRLLASRGVAPHPLVEFRDGTAMSPRSCAIRHASGLLGSAIAQDR
ncbi:MAG: hypothetical protein GDA43_21345 [Hormoscilla sp. SP5CHS1]|nr:hypothetical protein [Hormoscilla sp. SP12CHS1]MBC6455425.1 hypothetical protein [Hormoscilla sp. SP5CHS1]